MAKNNHPKGTYRCRICKEIFDGPNIYTEDSGNPKKPILKCGKFLCNGLVEKLSSRPKKEYIPNLKCPFSRNY